MDIFKLFFEHDLRLDQLRERKLDRSTQEVSGSIEAFLKPDPTYSKFYFTGTLLPDELFGIDQISHYQEVKEALCNSLNLYHAFTGRKRAPLNELIETEEIGRAIILSTGDENRWADTPLDLDDDSNVGHKKSELAEVLQAGDLVLYKEKAHQGFDLHLFSEKNIYPLFFEPFRSLLNDQFRFFSINGKRIRSERKFYFETWTLDRPPHGAEEVFPETVL
ncbi:MAG: hypothetical protein JJU46_12655 [Balneolaceae bacterium]|nr:hypothetical protein [Balneolaceae bacterium]MCH8549408.1 hypothetical protein [Balneolaceae bacterium]